MGTLYPRYTTETGRLASIDSRNQECRCGTLGLVGVRAMSGCDDQTARADEVPISTVNCQTVLRVVRDAAVVLLVLGVSEQNHALDLLPDGCGGIPDSGCCQGSTLAI